VIEFRRRKSEGKMKLCPILIFMLVASLASVGQQARQATLAQQKMCDQQARKSFHESNPTPQHFLTFEYTSHYDPKMNVCYVEKEFAGYIGKSESLTVSWAVWDAFEGRGYASYIKVGPDVMDCEITRPGHPIEWCKTGDEFEDLVQKYFGIGR
jgi:hypothetical protein